MTYVKLLSRILIVTSFDQSFLVFQSTKPKCGVFCHLITEVRETTALEMPDKENTFVVRVCIFCCPAAFGFIFVYNFLIRS